jgi:hypothetical protein
MAASEADADEPKGERAMKPARPRTPEDTARKADDRPFDQDSPQVEYQDLPSHYQSMDVPHVLARIRASQRFFTMIGMEHPNETYSTVYAEHLDTLERELRPYALDLALSLIALEDSLGKKDRTHGGVNPSPALSIADVVTSEHGATFAEEWWRRTTDAMVQAFSETGVVEWPEDSRPAQMRFHDIEDEITVRIFEELRSAAAETFVRIANEVLTRERIR